MKTLLIAAAVVLSTPALAENADDYVAAVNGMSLTVLYNDHCEKIPGLVSIAAQVNAAIPAGARERAIELGAKQAKEQFTSVSTPMFCTLMKPIIARRYLTAR